MKSPKMYQKKRFKGKKSGNLKYLYSEWMGEDLGWVDTFRDIEHEKTLEAYYRARADYEERDFQRKMNMWNLNYKRLAKK